MPCDVRTFTFPEDEQEIVDNYLLHQCCFDDLVKDLNVALKIRWEETFLDFLISQHDLYREKLRVAVAFVKGIPQGLVCYTVEGDIFVSYLIVAELHRKEGIGKALLDAVSQCYPESTMRLICPRRQYTAEHFYLKQGFLLDPAGLLAKALWLYRPASLEVNHDLP